MTIVTVLCDGFLCVPVSVRTVTVVRMLCGGFMCVPVSVRTVTVVRMLCDGFLCAPVSVRTVTVVRMLCGGFMWSVTSSLDCDSYQNVVWWIYVCSTECSDCDSTHVDSLKPQRQTQTLTNNGYLERSL